MKKVAVVLADGFEEIEALAPSDILKRLGYEVVLAGIKPGVVHGSHGFPVQAPAFLGDLPAEGLDALVLPGGLPGATNLRDCDLVIRRLREMHAAGKTVAAICAAPIVLHKAGLTGGRRITGYPGSEQMAPGLTYTGERTETDRGVVTGKGPGAAFEFAFALAAALGSTAEEIRNVKQQMLVL